MLLPLAAVACLPLVGGRSSLPFGPWLWAPDNGRAQWVMEVPGLEMNGDYLRGPRPGQDRGEWLRKANAFRDATVGRRFPDTVRFDYDGERAYIRMKADIARQLELRAGETISFSLEVRVLSGRPQIGAAFDFLKRGTNEWIGWSGILATGEFGGDGQWQRREVTVTVPDLPKDAVAVPIVGQDGTRTQERFVCELRDMTAAVPRAPKTSPSGLDLSLYARKDLTWNSKGPTCAYLFVYDSEYFDRKKQDYDVERFVRDYRRNFGGLDSVQFWQAYPRIGVDDRNQFDFYRDLPGGVAGVRKLVRRFHRLGVKVWLPYNPWDVGTRREKESDSPALARMLHDTEADGLFLDTMYECPADLRANVDSQRKGVVFEPESDTSIEELQACTGSWAQWQQDYPEPALILFKWLEPRHMRHAIRRSMRTHYPEIEAAFFNGSGVMVWENVFGSWNPWTAQDRLDWARASRILRAYASQVCVTRPDPFVPSLRPDLYVNRWTVPGGTLYIVVNRGDTAVESPILDNDASGEAVELFSGAELKRQGRAIVGKIGHLAAILVASEPAALAKARRIARGNADWSVASPDATPQTRLVGVGKSVAPSLDGMVRVPAMQTTMRVEHTRRECGCYADPGVTPEREPYFTFGIGDSFGRLVHDVPVSTPGYWIDETLVTNAEFESFLQATGYAPAVGTNFLKHWQGKTCPPKLRDLPVVYVDLDDARAYAKWRGKRLPTEEEWVVAGRGPTPRKWPWGDRFEPFNCNDSRVGPTQAKRYPQGRSPYGCYDMSGNVWQWTESERDDGHTRWCVIRGGSWFKAEGSFWYVEGGAQPLDSHTKFLLASPGLDRCATIGFRCVADNP